MRRSARAHLACQRLARHRAGGLVGKVQPHILVFEQPLILLENGVARLGQNLDQRRLVQLVQNAHHRQAADKLRNQPVLDQILRLGLAQQFGIAMRAHRRLGFRYPSP